MFEAVGYHLKRLVRVRVGNLRIGDLPRGHWRLLTKRELASLSVIPSEVACHAVALRQRREDSLS
jgi:16S rRNA U516 pseudouridylate synthase RsuA-like enzyme